MPLNPFQTTVSINLGGTNSRIIEEPYRSLDITTNSRYAEVSVRHPLLRRARQDSTQEFALSLTGSRLESTSALGNTPYPLSPGADDNGRIGVSALRFGQEYIQYGSVEQANPQFWGSKSLEVPQNWGL